MFKKLAESSGWVVGYSVAGKLTPADYQRLTIEFETLVEEEGKVRLLLMLDEFQEAELTALWDDFKFGAAYNKNIDRLALVGDNQWEAWLAAVSSPFFTGKTKYFHSDNRRQAWEWLRADDNLESIPYFREMYGAFTKSGCPFCRLLAREATRYIDSVLWGMVNDPAFRDELNLARGYCREHAWFLDREGAALGAAILMQDVLQTLLDQMDKRNFRQSKGSSLQKIMDTFSVSPSGGAISKLTANLAPQTACPICVKLKTTEQHYTSTLIKNFSGPNAFAEVFESSDGLCLLHFRSVLTQARRGPNLRAFIEAQKTVWQRLNIDLNEFIRKNDYRFRDEPFGKEGDSWLRALEAISGAAHQSNARGKGLTQALLD